MNTQSVNFRIFLPLRFYVKSSLVILKAQKLPFWSFVEQLWILHFWNFWHFQMWYFSINQNSKHSKLLRRQFLTAISEAARFYISRIWRHLSQTLIVPEQLFRKFIPEYLFQNFCFRIFVLFTILIFQIQCIKIISLLINSLIWDNYRKKNSN